VGLPFLREEGWRGGFVARSREGERHGDAGWEVARSAWVLEVEADGRLWWASTGPKGQLGRLELRDGKRKKDWAKREKKNWVKNFGWLILEFQSKIFKIQTKVLNSNQIDSNSNQS
jgi:hypothetical protein